MVSFRCRAWLAGPVAACRRAGVVVVAGGGGAGVPWPGPPALPSFQTGLASRQPSSELAEGAGLLTLINRFHPRSMRALPLAVGARPRRSRGGVHLLAGAAPPSGDAGVPGDAAGDDRVDLAEQRGGDRGTGLLVGELVFGAAGQAGVPGGVDRVMAQRAPDGAPGSQPQRGPAAAGDAGPGRRGCRWSSHMAPGRRA